MQWDNRGGVGRVIGDLVIGTLGDRDIGGDRKTRILTTAEH
jgi:hypothetical protein